MTFEEKISKFQKIIDENDKIVFFGGAGVSTESGIPDFRSKDGLYNQHDVQFEKYSPEYLLSNECLYHEPKVFFEFYRQKMDAKGYGPNIAHQFLAELESRGKLTGIVTQNIDGLHQKAGSKKVYEIHGTTEQCTCTKCGKGFHGRAIFDSKDAIPKCPECGGMLRPNVVLYGEGLPADAVNGAIHAIREASVMIIAGTSLKVYPAASYIYEFSGEHTIVINREKIDVQMNPETDIVFENSLGEVISKLH